MTDIEQCVKAIESYEPSFYQSGYGEALGEPKTNMEIIKRELVAKIRAIGHAVDGAGSAEGD